VSGASPKVPDSSRQRGVSRPRRWPGPRTPGTASRWRRLTAPASGRHRVVVPAIAAPRRRTEAPAAAPTHRHAASTGRTRRQSRTCRRSPGRTTRGRSRRRSTSARPVSSRASRKRHTADQGRPTGSCARLRPVPARRPHRATPDDGVDTEEKVCGIRLRAVSVVAGTSQPARTADGPADGREALHRLAGESRRRARKATGNGLTADLPRRLSGGSTANPINSTRGPWARTVTPKAAASESRDIVRPSRVHPPESVALSGSDYHSPSLKAETKPCPRHSQVEADHTGLGHLLQREAECPRARSR